MFPEESGRYCMEAPGFTTTLLGETAPNTAMCVSPPVPKGPMPPFPLPPLNKAGGHPPPQWRMANEEATGEGCKRTCRTVVQAVTPLFLCLFPWRFMLLPLNPFPRRACVVVAPLQMRNLNVKTPSSLWTFHHAVPSPSFSTWELSVTENQCQSVCT